jgi:hypothetical protein
MRIGGNTFHHIGAHPEAGINAPKVGPDIAITKQLNR